MNKTLLPLLVFAMLLPALSYAAGLLKYNPPPGTGAPHSSNGGGTRGFGLKQLQALAPRHTALSSQSQPVLYWYSSQAKQEKARISVVKEGPSQAVLVKQIEIVATAGLQSVRLADYGVFLEEGELYRWIVAVGNSEPGSGTSLANTVSATLRYQLPASPLSSVEQLADAGYWYDALQQLIEKNSPLVNDLLKQVGIQIPDL